MCPIPAIPEIRRPLCGLGRFHTWVSPHQKAEGCDIQAELVGDQSLPVFDWPEKPVPAASKQEENMPRRK